MRRFLLVGCGGSGGATLRFAMDQLKAELSNAGVGQLPAAWQFLHIDVPTNPDSGPGLLRSVVAQGGAYCALSYLGATYGGVAAGVDLRFRSAPPRLNALASWRPDPALVQFPITEGAGQYRAVGRVLTLARAGAIQQALGSAWARLQDAAVNVEMQRLAANNRLPGIRGANPTDAPIILIISSLAGGSGASMVLDVARLLGTIAGVPKELIGMFLFSPDVFEALDPAARPGVEPNAAAALAELIAMQADSQEAEAKGAADSYQAMGLVGIRPGGAFQRAFPVGRKIGAGGAIIGDGHPMTIYRALGRGLAALMVSSDVSDNFADFDITNPPVGDARRDQFGWGVEPNHLAWGSFGYSSMSLGRERYAEYAAQRLARLAVDRLASGHLQHDDPRSGSEQVRDLVQHQVDNVLLATGLPARVDPLLNWFESVAMPGPLRTNTASGLVTEKIRAIVTPSGEQSNAAQWVANMEARLANTRPEILSKLDGAVDSWAIQWHRDLADRLVRQTEQAISTLGLPYAIELLGQIRGEVDRVSAFMVQAPAAAADPLKLPSEQQRFLDEIRRVKGGISNAAAVSAQLQKGYTTSISNVLSLRGASMAGRILASFSTGMVARLRQACADALANIEQARKAYVSDVGIAQLATNDYNAWPRDGRERVPGRFDHAENEILITPASEFPEQFETHLAAEYPTLGQGDRRNQPTAEILSGRWETVSGQPAPLGLIEQTSRWWADALSNRQDPDTGQPIMKQNGGFIIHVAPGEVLERGRQWVARPQQPFAEYIGLSLHDFVTDPQASDTVRAERERMIVEQFQRALNLASPVVGVNQHAATYLHTVHVRMYKFGPVPFKGLPIAARMSDVLRDQSEGFSTNLPEKLERALTDSSPATRIDIFGSYPGYYPVVFTSFLQPIASRWAATPEFGRSQFWQWRRSRPLAEAIPVGQAQRRAMVAGWLIGQATGNVKVPRDVGKRGADPVEVWDTESAQWVAFPDPPLTAYATLHDRSDVLAAVLESMTLAVANSHDSAHQEPLRPFTALRRLYDNGATGPTEGMYGPIGGEHLARWVRDGQPRSGRSILGTGGTAAGRTQSLIDWLDNSKTAFKRLGEQGNRSMDDRYLLSDLWRDLVWATERLEELVQNLPDVDDAIPPVDDKGPLL